MMLSRTQLQFLNKGSFKYPLQIAEKDYVLALVMQLISTSSLGEKLVFKGGTALHHCYLDQYRYSENLDFSSGGNLITLEEVREVLTSFDYLEIKKEYTSRATIKIERLLFTGPLGHPNSVKVEIDFLQNVLLPPRTLPYRTAWDLEFPVRVMDIREICAEKIRAMSDRSRYRDFYDLFLILDELNLDIEEIISFVRQKEIREPITKASILKNWKVSIDRKEEELNSINFLKVVEDDQILSTISKLPFEEISR